jgi:hypothetical protein
MEDGSLSPTFKLRGSRKMVDVLLRPDRNRGYGGKKTGRQEKEVRSWKLKAVS